MELAKMLFIECFIRWEPCIFLINLFFDGNLQEQGIVIGSTIQAVGQVTAAGFIMGNEVGEMATLIKMIRILMLGPILILLTLLYSSENKQSNKKSTSYKQMC